MTRRNLIAVTVTIALLAGCSTPPGKTAQETTTPLSQRKVTATVVTNAPPAATPPPKARVVPLTARIASVNEKLRFVIVDFTARLQKSPRGEYELPDAITALLSAGHKIAGCKTEGRWVDVRDPEVLAELETQQS